MPSGMENVSFQSSWISS